MEEENEYVQEDVVEQEEQTSEEVMEDESTEEVEENEVTLSKEEFTKLKRKAIAYDANKSKPSNKPAQSVQQTDTSDNYLEEVFMVKDLSQNEYEALRNESSELGIPFKKYLASESGKIYLSKIRKEEKSKESMESLSSKSPVYKKFTQKDISKMSASEMEKILSDN